MSALSVLELVAAGAAWLDERVPGWWQRINLDALRMKSCEWCVLGQVFGHFDEAPRAGRLSGQLGFGFPEVSTEDPLWDALDETWRDLVTRPSCGAVHSGRCVMKSADSAAPSPGTAAGGAPSAVSAGLTRPADGALTGSAAGLRSEGSRNQVPPAARTAGGTALPRAQALSGSVRPPQSSKPFAAADDVSLVIEDASASRPGWGSGRDVTTDFDSHVAEALAAGFTPVVDPLGPRLVQPAPVVDPALVARRCAVTDAAAQRARLTAELNTALNELRVAKATFATITDIYRRHSPDPVTAEFRASANYDRQRAVVDAAWWRCEADTAALALIALGGAR